MWIIMTKTYAGVEGIFAKGLRFDLPEAQCKQLTLSGGKCWKNSNPPWEDRIDQKAVKQAKAGRAYEIAKARAEMLAGAAEAIRKAINACDKPVAEARTAVKAAKERAVLAQSKAERKNATNEQKQEAIALAREHKRLDAHSIIAFARMRLLTGEYTLKRLEAEDAVTEANQLAKELATKSADPAAEPADPARANTADPAANDESQGPPVPPGDQPGVSNEVRV